MDSFGTFLRALGADGPKKAGDTIKCLKCRGRGYTPEGLTSDYPVECPRCSGSGVQIVKPSR